MASEVTADNLTDEQIQTLRDGVDDDLRRIALQRGVPTGLHPWCRSCGWRMGGPHSWDGNTCKCKLRVPEYFRCSRCVGIGCPSCDDSGLVDPIQIMNARRLIADTINARPREGESMSETKWEIVCNEEPDRVRRFRVVGGYLYQIEKLDVEDGLSRINHYGWHPPIFVADHE